MSGEQEIVAIEGPSSISEPKRKAKTKPRAKTEAKLKTRNGGSSDHAVTGRVMSIRVESSGSNGGVCQFGLVDKKGVRHNYLLDPSDDARFGVFLNLLTASQSASSKVCVSSAPNDNGFDYATSLEIRSKR